MTREELEKIAEEKYFSPLEIGVEILRQLGYKVEEFGFGYNSIGIRIYDKETNKLIHSENIGE